MKQNFFSYLFCCFLLTSCAVGPDFQRPTAPKIQHYTEKPMPKITAVVNSRTAKKQYFKLNKNIPKRWWSVFQSKALDQLIKDALIANPDVKSAMASLRYAHEFSKIRRSALLPLLSGNVNPVRQLTAGTLASNLSSNAYLYTLTTESLSITYMPDVFGLTRRQVESAVAYEEAALYGYEAILLTLTSNVVLTAIREASLRRQIATATLMIQTMEKLLLVVTEEKKLGEVGIEAVMQQQALLSSVQAILPTLQLQLAQNRHLLASLLGHYSSENLNVSFTLDDFVLPHELPVSIPSELINNRPDIRVAEARMHAASAQIGVAKANRLPNIFLSANGGYLPVTESLASIPSFLAPLPLGPSLFWNLGANMVGTILDGGSLYFQQRAAVAAYDNTIAQYKRVVLNAFESVADSLKAIEFDTLTLKHTQIQVIAAEKAFNAARHKRELGYSTYLDLLFSERIYQQALFSLAQIEASRYEDTVALFQALGGGWSTKKDQKV